VTEFNAFGSRAPDTKKSRTGQDGKQSSEKAQPSKIDSEFFKKVIILLKYYFKSCAQKSTLI